MLTEGTTKGVDLSLLAGDLKELYPHGHPGFIPATLAEISLHDEKNHDYASGGDPLGNFRRVAAIKALYPGFPWDTAAGVAISFMLKQFDAVLWGMAKGIKHKVEGFTGRLQDISVYAKIVNLILQEDHDHEL